jgi:hypothetical protein
MDRRRDRETETRVRDDLFSDAVERKAQRAAWRGFAVWPTQMFKQTNYGLPVLALWELRRI